ncbi:MAG TPA: carbon starvation protein A [Polyangiaceae bacterium]|jgi:carbon starvation protein
MHAAVWMLGALAVLSIAYRYYSAFLAAKVMCLDDARVTPAHERNDGQNFHPTNRWVLFGHHFAAITGAGPLIGPVLAAQFGFYPGFLWILFGVVLAGAVHDFVILVASTRRGGRSLAEIARLELGPTLGLVTAIAILFIVVIALAGLGNVVVGALAESAWGVFTVGSSIPIALAMGLYIYRVRGGSTRGIREATAGGLVLLLAALIYGKTVADTPALAEHLKLSRTVLTGAMATYGFAASILPVWMLLCPRDYLSSYLKIGTILLLVGGVIVVNPPIQMPGVTQYIHGGGPILKGPLFPFVFITIACGAISGFHALVSSGTTPKMIDKERDCRPIGYGAMLMEGLVGITALIAACVMPPEDYVTINTDPKIALVASDATHDQGLARSFEDLARASSNFTPHDRELLGTPAGDISPLRAKKLPASKVLALSNGTLAALGYHVDPAEARATTLDDADFARLGIHVKELPALSQTAGEVVAARTGGGVSLAVGMARVFSGLPGMSTLLAYWYHFAIMFEALFILTTIDTGTRIGRFLLQELVGRAVPELGESTSRTGAVLSTACIVAGWSWFIIKGTISTIWPMFGIANQLLACTALCIATTIILRESPKRVYAWVTLAPLLFVGTTTLTAGVESMATLYLPMMKDPATYTMGIVNVAVTGMLIVCVLMVLVGSALKWLGILRGTASGPAAVASA